MSGMRTSTLNTGTVSKCKAPDPSKVTCGLLSDDAASGPSKTNNNSTLKADESTSGISLHEQATSPSTSADAASVDTVLESAYT